MLMRMQVVADSRAALGHFFFVVLALIGGSGCDLAGRYEDGTVQERRIYWADAEEGTVRRAAVDGGASEVVVRQRVPQAVALDGTTVLWADGACCIKKRVFGKSESEVVVGSTQGKGVSHLVVDPDRSVIYWIEGGSRIMRAGLDGTKVEALVTGARFRALALDQSRETLYWGTFEGSIERLDLRGGPIEQLIVGIQSIFDLAVDPVRNKIYWADNNAGKIGRANLNGSEINEIPLETYPFSLTIDAEVNQLFWSDADHIYQTKLGDFQTETLVEDIDGIPENLVLSEAASDLYWLETSFGGGPVIQRTNAITGATKTWLRGIPQPLHVVVDQQHQRLFWTAPQGLVMQGALNTKRTELLANVFCGETTMGDLALDRLRETLYWVHATDCGSVIERKSVKGGAVETVTAIGGWVNEMGGIAVDIYNSKVYWSVGPAPIDQGIYRANLDGSDREQVIVAAGVSALAFDHRAQKIYWVQGGKKEDTIQRANLGGFNQEQILEGLADVVDLALDLETEKLYWSERQSGRIRRANLNGTAVEDVVTGLPAPMGIALETGE